MAANALIEVLANGRTRTLVLPPSPLVPFPRDAVPTSVTEGPAGALYAGLITGFPFFQGSASVLRIASDGYRWPRSRRRIAAWAPAA